MRRLRTLSLGLLILCALTAAPAPAQEVDTQPAVAVLRDLLADPTADPLAWAALQLRADADLTPVLTAMTRSDQRSIRLLGTTAFAEVAGKAAAPSLLERLQTDPASTIRAEALAQLIRLDAISTSDLLEALDIDDDMVRCLAARALAAVRPDRAVDTLTALAQGGEQAVSASAQATLLKLGHQKYFDPLRALFASSETPDELLGLLLLQFEDEKIDRAADLARQLAQSDRPAGLRLEALRVLTVIAPRAAVELRSTIQQSDRQVFCVQVLRIMADLPDGPASVADLLDDSRASIRLLAHFELARLADVQEASETALAAVRLQHPVVVEYILAVAADDIEDEPRRAAAYVPALWEIIDQAPAGHELTRKHFLAAQAVSLLADLGHAESLDLLVGVLEQPYSAGVRAVAAGLMTSNNPVVCDVMAPLLASPYSELAVDAAMALGSHRDPRANAHLLQILAQPDRYATSTITVSAWYLLKNAGQTHRVAKELAAEIR
jgi:HEAT repeat protein